MFAMKASSPVTGHSKSPPIRIHSAPTETCPCSVFDPGDEQVEGNFSGNKSSAEKNHTLPEQESTAGFCARVIGVLRSYSLRSRMVGGALCKPSMRPGPDHPASGYRARTRTLRFVDDSSTVVVTPTIREGLILYRWLRDPIDAAMSFVVILFTLILGICNSEARRTTTATSTLTTFDKIGEPQRGRQADLENVWDLVELQKLDNHANAWNKESSRGNTTEPQVPDEINTKQLYPTVPNPGDTNELPGPIPPGFVTIKPIPVVTPAPGCYAPRGQFPSPRSCASYLNCWDDVVTEQVCPNGLLFNDYTLVCDYDYNVNCGSRPLPIPKPSLPSESEPCPDPNGRYRSATNCSEFYVCVYRKPIKFSCPRGLVYNDLLGVCDYPYNVDCKGAAIPSLPPPTSLPQTELPSLPPQPPTYAPPYQPLPPSSLPSQPPINNLPQQPSYGPSQPLQPSSYPLNPWLSKTEPDPWHQRPVSSQLEVNKQQEETQEHLDIQQQPVDHIQNPWNLLQSVPASLSMVPCKNGDMHRLNDSCTNVVVCRNGRPQLVQCSVGLTYDRASDTCKPFSIAKC